MGSMRLLRSKRRPAGIGLALGLLACASLGLFGWQYEQAVRQAQLNRNLLNAISSQQAAEVQALLRAGADPNARVLPNTPPPPRGKFWPRPSGVSGDISGPRRALCTRPPYW